MVCVPPERFEELVTEALASIPVELRRQMRNVAIVIDDGEPPVPGLLGLYEGVPLPERGVDYAGVLPDTITVFGRSLCARSDTESELIEDVRVTIVHEVAHHFGIDDARLAELGWD